MHSKAKGTIGEAKAIQHFLQNGFRVFTEFGDLSRIDLIVEKNNQLLKIQVKSYTSKDNKVVLYSKKAGPNYNFHYTEGDVDIFAVYILDKDELFYVSAKELCAMKSGLTFRLAEPKNGQKKMIRYPKDYTLERILRDYTPNTLTSNVEGDDIVQTTTGDELLLG